jgi:hypothetical protein
MKLEQVENLMWNWYLAEGQLIEYCPPEAKFITGNPKSDARLHYFKTHSGLELSLTKDFRHITAYRIVDREKYMMFVLRFS